eukprot:6477821-Pyramimonas_sp.AAC.1
MKIIGTLIVDMRKEKDRTCWMRIRDPARLCNFGTGRAGAAIVDHAQLDMTFVVFHPVTP